MKFQKKITWLVCLFTLGLFPFKKLIKWKSGDLYNIIFQHIRKSIRCYSTHATKNSKIFIITWSKVTSEINPPQRFPRHMSLMKYAVVNCGKTVVNRGKKTNLEVVLFFRIRMCLLLCLFVAVSIFKCSISGFLELSGLWPTNRRWSLVLSSDLDLLELQLQRSILKIAIFGLTNQQLAFSTVLDYY